MMLFECSTLVHFVVTDPPVLGRERDTKLTVELTVFNFGYEFTQQPQEMIFLAFLLRVLGNCFALIH